MRGKRGLAFTVSMHASSVRFGLGTPDKKPVVFDLAAASLRIRQVSLPGLRRRELDGLPVTDWRNNTAPKFGRRARS